jgi:hypothetical protein
LDSVRSSLTCTTRMSRTSSSTPTSRCTSSVSASSS